MACCGSISVHLEIRQKMTLNNSAELLTCGDGNSIYLVSKAKNEFQAHRELLLVSTHTHTERANVMSA